jgi:hypothetical protein
MFHLYDLTFRTFLHLYDALIALFTSRKNCQESEGGVIASVSFVTHHPVIISYAPCHLSPRGHQYLIFIDTQFKIFPKSSLFSSPAQTKNYENNAPGESITLGKKLHAL